VTENPLTETGNALTETIVRLLRSDDAEEVRRIFLEGIASGNATFETTTPEWPQWDGSHRKDCRFVAVEGDRVLGWAALSAVSMRKVYAGVAEVSVYVSADARGRGVESMLLSALVEASEAAGLWTLQAGIFPENAASLALHARHGFRRLGLRERVGYGHGRWRDVVLLERRSARTGVEPPV
jgi:phosphinothricin acetyltransferase